MQPVIDRFLKAGVARESQGAIVVDVSDVLGREIAPCMLQKSDGASTYAARDCAEAIDRWERYQFGANVYVVSRQEDHFAQVFAALGKLAVAEQWPVNWPALCENVSFGYVRGMSTRKGEAVWLEAVLDEARDRAARYREERSAANARALPEVPAAELASISEAVGQAALLYFDVSSRRLTDVTFDWDTVLQFEGNTGPYLQYTHARMSGIFRKAARSGPGHDGRARATCRCWSPTRSGPWCRSCAASATPCGARRNSASPSRWPTTCTSSRASSMLSTTGTSCWTRPIPRAAGPGWPWWAARARCWRVACSLLGIRPLEYM